MSHQRYSTPMNKQELVHAKREQILSVARKHGAVSVKLFGLGARGDEVDSSDLDFVVELESGRSLLDLGGLQADLERLLMGENQRDEKHPRSPLFWHRHGNCVGGCGKGISATENRHCPND